MSVHMLFGESWYSLESTFYNVFTSIWFVMSMRISYPICFLFMSMIHNTVDVLV